MEIDTLVVVIADQNGGKSNQMRSLFEEHEMHHFYGGYPQQRKIASRYLVAPDVELFLRLSSWHEKGDSYAQVKQDIQHHRQVLNRRYKVFVPAQVTATPNLMMGEQLFMRLFQDFQIRRGFAVWLNPDRFGRKPFALTPTFAQFLSGHREASTVAIDSLALHPSASPSANAINARLFGDMLFRA